MTPFSSKKALYPLEAVDLPFPRRDFPPEVERRKEMVRAYCGEFVELGTGDEDDEDGAGEVLDAMVIRSVTICLLHK